MPKTHAHALLSELLHEAPTVRTPSKERPAQAHTVTIRAQPDPGPHHGAWREARERMQDVATVESEGKSRGLVIKDDFD